MICLFHLQNWFYFQIKSFVSMKLKIAQIIFLIMTFTVISYNNVLARVHYYLVSVLSTLSYKQVSNKVWCCHIMFKLKKNCKLLSFHFAHCDRTGLIFLIYFNCPWSTGNLLSFIFLWHLFEEVWPRSNLRLHMWWT